MSTTTDWNVQVVVAAAATYVTSRNVAVVVANVAEVNGTTVTAAAANPVTPLLMTVIVPLAVPDAPRVLTVRSSSTRNATVVPDAAAVTAAVATDASLTVPRMP